MREPEPGTCRAERPTGRRAAGHEHGAPGGATWLVSQKGFVGYETEWKPFQKEAEYKTPKKP